MMPDAHDPNGVQQFVCSTVADVCALRLALRLDAIDSLPAYSVAIQALAIDQFFARLNEIARRTPHLSDIKYRLAEQLKLTNPS